MLNKGFRWITGNVLQITMRIVYVKHFTPFQISNNYHLAIVFTEAFVKFHTIVNYSNGVVAIKLGNKVTYSVFNSFNGFFNCANLIGRLGSF